MGGIGVALAIGVGLLSSFIQSLGLTIQRKSHIQNDALPLPSQRKPIRRPLWLIGFGIYITTNIFSTIFQLDALPIVILAPLGAVSLIYNALLARLILGDRFGVRMVGGTALVAAGAVLIAVFGVVEEGEHSIEELLRLWGRPAFLAFFWVVIGLTLIVLIVSHIVSFFTYRSLRSIRLPMDEDEHPITSPSLPPSNYASPHNPTPIAFRATNRRWSTPLTSSRSDGLPTLSSLNIPSANGDTPTPISDSQKPYLQPHTVRFVDPPTTPPPIFPTPIATYADPTPAQQKTIMTLGLSFAAASGVLSGMSLVLAKAAVELLVITLEHYRTGKGANQFQHPQSWFLVAGLLSGGLAQLVYLNYSLTFASPALICPLAFCFFNLSSIFDGLVFYDQFSRLKTHQIVLVSLGVALLLIGVWVVSVVEPTGQGGVDLGTWVEEEDEEGEGAALLRIGSRGSSIGSFLASRSPDEEPQAETTHISPDPASPTRQYSHPDTRAGRPDMLRNDTFPFHPSSPPASPTSPTSPRRRRIRYGTLLPELAPVGAPTGFSIGLGAASPGFVLRPGPFAGGVEGRTRSRSEGAKGIQEIMAGRGLGIDGAGLEPAMGQSPHGAGTTSDGDRGEGTVEEDGTKSPGSNPAGSGGGWWSRLFRRKEGTIRLETDDQA